MNLDTLKDVMGRVVDTVDVRQNETRWDVAGTIGTAIAILTGLSVIINDYLLPGLQTALGMLGAV